ncbi:T9SS type A sorting domain-containing protein [Flavobacterium sp. LBUM151]
MKENIVDSNEITIYPNPSDGNFYVGFDNLDTTYSIEIVSFAGQKVFEKQNTTDSAVSVSHLAKGIYIVQIITDSKTIIKKIIIN